MKILITISLVMCILLSTTATQAAQLTLTVIPLKHRTVDEIIPIIKPLVHKGGTVTGMNNQLIVKTTPSNLRDIKLLLQSIDKAARRLMISVKQDIEGNINRREQSISGSYSTGDIKISGADRGRSRDGVVITATDDEGNTIRLRNLSTRSSLDDKNTFRVQTIEGQPAFIETGQSVPVANQQAFVTAGGVVVQDTVEYRNVTSGFYVVPRLNGNNVTLLVSPKLSRVHPHQGAVFDIQNIETTVSGRLGEWIEIGGVNQQFNDSSRGTLYSTRRRQGQEQRSVLIKVEEIR